MDPTATKFSGGHRYKFVSDIPDSLICFLCQLPSRDPVLTTCCGYNACQGCLEQYKRSVRPSASPATTILACPKCLDYDFQAYPNKMSRRDLYSLHVFCINETAGCSWRGKLDDLDTHLTSSNGCLYEITRCPRSCGTSLLRVEIASHCKNECPLLIINCSHCLVRGEKRFIEGQHLEECSKAPVNCPNNCGVDITNESLMEHRQTCPLEVVTCHFSSFGCNTMVTRQESDFHNKDSAAKHLELVKGKLAASTKELQSSKVQLAKLKENLNAFQSTFAYSIIEVLSMVKMLDTLDSTKQKQEVNNLQKQISLCRQNLMFVPDYQVTPVVIKMNDFTRYRNEGSNWFSLPFYTHKGGYKVCLVVVAGGYESVKGSYMSVYACLMKGIHDNELAWPMEGTLQVHLLNQVQSNDSSHFMTISMPDTPLFPLRSTMRVAQEYARAYQTHSGWRNTDGLGVQKFIPLSKLDKATASCQYLKNDCIYFRVEYSKRSSNVGSPKPVAGKKIGRMAEQGSPSGSPRSYRAPQEDVPLVFKDDESVICQESPVIQRNKPVAFYAEDKPMRHSPLVKQLLQENKLTQEGSNAKFIPETDTEL